MPTQQRATAQGWTFINEMTSLSCTARGIQSAFGIGQLSTLNSLNLSSNQLTTIDVSALSSLQQLTLIDNSFSQTAISYLDSIHGANGLVVTRVIPVAIIEEEAVVEEPTASEEVTEAADAIDDEITDIAIPDDGAEVSPETADAIVFSGTFGFDDVTEKEAGSDNVSEFTLNTPQGTDPSDLDYTYTVDYPDGRTQNIAPFVADDSFFDSLGSRGLKFNTSRSNGVVTITDANTAATTRFRPDYFVTPLDASGQAFLEENADPAGSNRQCG